MFLKRLLLAALLAVFAVAVGAEEPAVSKKPISFEEAMAEDGSQPPSEPATFQPVEPETPAADQPAPEADQSTADKSPTAKQTSNQPLPVSIEEKFTAPDGQTGQLEMAPSEKPKTKTRMPAGGLTMKEVESSFGTPENKVPAVGDPPITRWIYRDYTVYFEHNRVVHSVYNDPRDDQP